MLLLYIYYIIVCTRTAVCCIATTNDDGYNTRKSYTYMCVYFSARNYDFYSHNT